MAATPTTMSRVMMSRRLLVGCATLLPRLTTTPTLGTPKTGGRRFLSTSRGPLLHARRPIPKLQSNPAEAASVLGSFIGVPDLGPGEAITMPASAICAVLEATMTDKKLQDALFAHSAAVTERFVGKNVYYRGLIEFSNVCAMDCDYCGIRKHQKGVKRYTMPHSEIMEVAEWALEKEYGSVMLQSGELYTPERMKYLLTIIPEIRKRTLEMDTKRGKGLAISLSVGELPEEDYQKLFDAGAQRYLLRIESSNPELFATLHPKEQTFEKRLQCLRTLKKIGYQIGTGVMIGVPGQTMMDLANDLVFFRDEDVDMIGMGPYIPATGTPVAEKWYKECAERGLDLKAHQMELFELTTRAIAIARITMGNVNLAATTALQAINPSGREIALTRGANILMPILTPTKYRADYQLYEGKPCITDTAAQCRSCLEMRVDMAGKRIAYGEWGDPDHYYNHTCTPENLRCAPDPLAMIMSAAAMNPHFHQHTYGNACMARSQHRGFCSKAHQESDAQAAQAPKKDE